MKKLDKKHVLQSYFDKQFKIQEEPQEIQELLKDALNDQDLTQNLMSRKRISDSLQYSVHEFDHDSKVFTKETVAALRSPNQGFFNGHGVFTRAVIAISVLVTVAIVSLPSLVQTQSLSRLPAGEQINDLSKGSVSDQMRVMDFETMQPSSFLRNEPF